jgi:cysteine synthase A
MVAQKRSGSVVTLLADSGDRYADTYFDQEWLTQSGLNDSAAAGVLVEFERSGFWP